MLLKQLHTFLESKEFLIICNIRKKMFELNDVSKHVFKHHETNWTSSTSILASPVDYFFILCFYKVCREYQTHVHKLKIWCFQNLIRDTKCWKPLHTLSALLFFLSLSLFLILPLYLFLPLSLSFFSILELTLVYN